MERFRRVTDESAFVRVFKAEMEAVAHQTLVETYTWANNMTFGAPSAELGERGEAWAKRIEDSGKTWQVLEALAVED